jgi:TRAP-type mannitol/chloroaromatic compound transport system substrate-binding protein
MTDRRKFLAKGGGALAAAAACTFDASHVIAQPKVQWRMSTAYPPALDRQHDAALRLAKAVEETSGGRFRIEVYPGGQIMDEFACFDAASKGSIEAFHAGPIFWGAKEPATQWFSTVPFDMNCEGMVAWFYQGDGLKLWEEAYAAFNLVPRPGPQNGPEMGGWFRKKVSSIGDYKGLKMRMPGLGGKVVARAGATVVTLPAGAIYAALERGVIDTSEWIGPYDDMKLGLHKTARYYYYPGWHQPGTTTEFTFNRRAYEALPVDLRRALDHAASAVQIYSLTDFHVKNAIALRQLRTEFKDKVEIVQFPAPMLRELKKFAAEVVKEESEKSPMARKVHLSFTTFQALVGPWDRVAEGAYHQLVVP